MHNISRYTIYTSVIWSVNTLCGRFTAVLCFMQFILLIHLSWYPHHRQRYMLSSDSHFSCSAHFSTTTVSTKFGGRTTLTIIQLVNTIARFVWVEVKKKKKGQIKRQIVRGRCEWDWEKGKLEKNIFMPTFASDIRPQQVMLEFQRPFPELLVLGVSPLHGRHKENLLPSNWWGHQFWCRNFCVLGIYLRQWQPCPKCSWSSPRQAYFFLTFI